MIKIARGGWSHIGVGAALALIGLPLYSQGHTVAGLLIGAAGLVLAGFMVYFFRDPDRSAPSDPDAVVAGADGWVRKIESLPENKYLNAATVRISTFLTPFDVHVNRSPIQGAVTALAYTPGRHILTIQQAASEYNEHSSIVIHGERTRCLVKQIVGPIVRRVVYWLHEGQSLHKGDRIGIMKFGSRLDVYLPESDVEVLVKRGDRVFAGQSIIARIRK